MKKIILFLSISFFVVSVTFATKNNKGKDSNDAKIEVIEVEAKIPFEPNVTIYTPKTIIYDDALDIIKYEGYSILDTANNTVLEVEATTNLPKRIKLDAGQYIVKVANQESPIYTISVSDENYNEFVIK